MLIFTSRNGAYIPFHHKSWILLRSKKVSELLRSLLRTMASFGVLSKQFPLFCTTRNGKLAIWLQIPAARVHGAWQKSKGFCFKSQNCCSWSHVIAEPFLKWCQWSVINDNDQLTFIASPVYDWMFLQTSELNPSHPWSGGDLSPLQIDKVCLWLMKFPYLHHFWGFALGEGSDNSQWGCVWVVVACFCCIHDLIL